MRGRVVTLCTHRASLAPAPHSCARLGECRETGKNRAREGGGNSRARAVDDHQVHVVEFQPPQVLLHQRQRALRRSLALDLCDHEDLFARQACESAYRVGASGIQAPFLLSWPTVCSSVLLLQR